MKDALQLFARSQVQEGVPLAHSAELQDSFVQLTARMVSELASDYSRFDSETSLRTRALVARAALEGLFRMRAAASSPDVAARIAFAAARDYARECRRLLNADPKPPTEAKGLVSSAEAERDSIGKKYGIQTAGAGKMAILEIAEIAGCFPYYRGCYSHLSTYVHSDYHSSAPETPNGMRIADDSVLLALCLGAETLAQYYRRPQSDEILAQAKILWEGRR